MAGSLFLSAIHSFSTHTERFIILFPTFKSVNPWSCFANILSGPCTNTQTASMGGMFQGSNDRHFHSCELLYKVEHTLEDMKWHTISIKPRRYRFYRYYSAPNGYNNIAEIEFLGQSGNKLTGEVIGYGDLIDDKASFKESAFDGNPLTFLPQRIQTTLGLALISESLRQSPESIIYFVMMTITFEKETHTNYFIGKRASGLHWTDKPLFPIH